MDEVLFVQTALLICCWCILYPRSASSYHEVMITFLINNYTALKGSKYGVFPGPYFPVFKLRPKGVVEKKVIMFCILEEFDS